jgi:3-hydroxybenzoate 6-monooxygenase
MRAAPIEVQTLVVGGGIGGLATALALSRRGLSAHVLEQAPEFGEIGAGVQLAPNALRVLDDLGVLQAVADPAVRPPALVMMNALTGDEITTLECGPAFLDAYKYPYVVTHRTDLLDAILTACRAEPRLTLEVGKQVSALRENGATVTVECADGTTYEAGAVIGADGIRSAVRTHILGDNPLDYVGDVAYRGTIPFSAMTRTVGRDNVVWWVGPGIHLIQYPVRGGQLLNQVAVFTARQHGEPDDWGLPAELESAFSGAAEHVAEGIRLINRDRRWVLRDRRPDATWTRGRATLLGDAAHPMAQYLAQGACQALEDAAWIAQCLETASDVEAAFAIYQAERLPRTAAVQQWARKMGEIVHAGGVTEMLRDALLANRESTDLRYFDWLYGYDMTVPTPPIVAAVR